MKTLVIGASANPERYSFKAANMLLAHNHEIELIGTKQGEIAGHSIQTDHPQFKDIDTVTMYVGPRHQPALYDYILSLNPRRIIFNPGAENEEFEELAQEKGIFSEEACTLVLLSTGQF
ncbi:hypothetical protein SAMN04515674_102456 [Pseudarcicella hirudinis]|uniref:CoA-binding domain-containing protein n=1 Tax=Pseudarcicella hirudinis TaxID=1079859 RepID=A0A1I5PHA7_9BACT|nr:CoA-binding protein [Pseudarcicella hirudinis]SFP32886.1 hypothetical protein SAMN04515674_102456 [Pseudarcicella hirudinis]